MLIQKVTSSKLAAELSPAAAVESAAGVAAAAESAAVPDFRLAH